jgi:hypothetical protein
MELQCPILKTPVPITGGVKRGGAPFNGEMKEGDTTTFSLQWRWLEAAMGAV